MYVYGRAESILPILIIFFTWIYIQFSISELCYLSLKLKLE